MLILLSGERGVGKSTACHKLVERVRRAHRTVGGVIGDAQFNVAGVKIGVELLDLTSGERRQQASAIADLGGRRVGRYSMDDAVLAWAAEIVLQAIVSNLDLVIVDEIGPLELSEGGGFAGALPALLARPAQDAVLVVRPELSADLAARLEALAPRLYTLTLTNRDETPAVLEVMLQNAWRASGRYDEVPFRRARN